MQEKLRKTLWAFGVVAAVAACSSNAPPPADAGADAGVDVGWTYGYVAPPPNAPAVLLGERWKRHWIDDIRPYWMMEEAFGTPEGNFPTYRGMDGRITAGMRTDRRPRMIARQTYVYAMGYLLTGEARLLELAKAGADWIVEHAKDPDHGGWYASLDADGNAQGTADKYAQDTAYCAIGLAAYYFVTRDPSIEAEVLAIRDLLFDPATYWDADNRRIRDGMNHAMTAEADQERDGGWELVAQLDPINGFMLLVQPVLSEASRRDQFLADMRTLAETMIDTFWADGIFWGVHSHQGRYGTRHVDFGHTLKAYWMLLQIDKRLDDHPFASFLAEHLPEWVERAQDVDHGRWAKAPTGAVSRSYGSDWWIYAEADQTAATLNLLGDAYVDWLASTGAEWLDKYVDPNQPIGEVIPNIKRDGSPGWPWSPTDTAKCFEWKNGYHSTEHALVMYILGQRLAGVPATLHFAVTPAEADTFVATPYFFAGEEVGRTRGAMWDVDGQTLQAVAVDFDRIR